MVGEAVVEQESLETLEHHVAALVITGGAEVLVQEMRVHVSEQSSEDLLQVQLLEKSGEARDEEMSGALDAVNIKNTIDEF